jgi:hypothetical protein
LDLFRFKKDIPEDLAGRSVAVVVDCGLWGCWYAVRVGQSLLLKSGEWLPVHFAHLTTGRVVGMRDLEAGRGTKHAEGWRASYQAVIEDRLKLGASL